MCIILFLVEKEETEIQEIIKPGDVDDEPQLEPIPMEEVLKPRPGTAVSINIIWCLNGGNLIKLLILH